MKAIIKKDVVKTSITTSDGKTIISEIITTKLFGIELSKESIVKELTK